MKQTGTNSRKPQFVLITAGYKLFPISIFIKDETKKKIMKCVSTSGWDLAMLKKP